MFFRRRFGADYFQAFAFAVGVLIMTAVLAGAPMYLNAIESLGLRSTLRELSAGDRNLEVVVEGFPLTARSVSAATERVDVALAELGDLVVGIGQESYTRDHLWAPDPELIVGGRSADLAVLHRFVEFPEHVEFVVGNAPAEAVGREEGIVVVEAAVPFERAELLGVSVGDEIWLTPSASDPPYLKVRVAGLFEPNDLREEFWLGRGLEATEPPAPSLVARHRLPLFLAGDSLFGAVTGGPASLGTNRWLVQLDIEQLKRQKPAFTTQQVEAAGNRLRKVLPESHAVSALKNRFDALRQKVGFARIPTMMMGGVLLLAASYYSIMAAGAFMARRRVDMARLWVRGSGRRQIALLFVAEAAFLVLVPAILAPFLAVGVISLIGQLPEYRSITFGSGMPVQLVWQAFAWSLSGGALVLIYMQWTIWKDSGKEVGPGQLSSRRVEGKPFFQRQYLDLLFFLFGGLVLWDLSTESSVLSEAVGPVVSVNPLLVFAPAIFLAVAVLFSLRVLPPMARMVSRLLVRRGPVWAQLVSSSFARVPITYAWPTAVLGMAAGTVVLSATIAATLEQSSVDQSGYEVGADLRILPVDLNSGPRTKILDEIRAIDGVSEVSAGLRTIGGTRDGGQGTPFEFLAVESGKFAEIGTFRADYASSPVSRHLMKLGPDESPGLPPLIVPAFATRVGLRMKTDVAHRFIQASMRLLDANGRSFTVALGSLGELDWQVRMGDVPRAAARPVEIAGLVFFEQTNDEIGTPANIKIDDLMYDESPDGPEIEGEVEVASPVVLESFDSADSWRPLASSLGVDTQVAGFEYSRDAGSSGSSGPAGRGLLIELGVGTNRGVRGVIRSASGSIPAIFSTTALEENGLSVGDETVLHVFDQSVPALIVGAVDYFPTMDPAGGGFVIVDVAQLWKYVSMSSFNSAGFLAELFVDLDDPRNMSVIDGVSSAIGGIHSVRSRDQLRESSVVSPLAVAGWRGASIVTATLAIVLALLALFTFAPMRPSSDRFNFGVLRALGERRRGLMVISFVEQFALLLIGVAAGAGAGLVMARLAVATATQAVPGLNALPPIVFSTNWNYLIGLVVSLAAVAMVITVFDVISVQRIDIAATVRTPGKSG
ncbi:MAG: FtsX-like permease family protein [Chloroflexi bacterium]|nr:FtsX-like permease family protein [Chloroflexota bacterium]